MIDAQHIESARVGERCARRCEGAAVRANERCAGAGARAAGSRRGVDARGARAPRSEREPRSAAAGGSSERTVDPRAERDELQRLAFDAVDRAVRVHLAQAFHEAGYAMLAGLFEELGPVRDAHAAYMAYSCVASVGQRAGLSTSLRARCDLAAQAAYAAFTAACETHPARWLWLVALRTEALREALEREVCEREGPAPARG